MLYLRPLEAADGPAAVAFCVLAVALGVLAERRYQGSSPKPPPVCVGSWLSKVLGDALQGARTSTCHRHPMSLHAKLHARMPSLLHSSHVHALWLLVLQGTHQHRASRVKGCKARSREGIELVPVDGAGDLVEVGRPGHVVIALPVVPATHQHSAQPSAQRRTLQAAGGTPSAQLRRSVTAQCSCENSHCCWQPRCTAMPIFPPHTARDSLCEVHRRAL